MTRSWDDSDLNFSNFEFLVLFEFKKLKVRIFSFWSRTHDDRNLELSMSRDKVSMVVSQYNKFESGISFLKEFIEKEVVVSGINNDCFMIRLDIISEDSKHIGFELCNVDSFFFKLGDKLNVRAHSTKFSRELEIRNVYNKREVRI